MSWLLEHVIYQGKINGKPHEGIAKYIQSKEIKVRNDFNQSHERLPNFRI